MQLPPARPEENPAPALMTDLFLLLFGTPSMQLPPARPEENPAPALMTDLFLLLFGTPSMQLPPARPEENPAPALMTDLFLLLFGVDNSTINMVHGIPNQESLALLLHVAAALLAPFHHNYRPQPSDPNTQTG